MTNWKQKLAAYLHDPPSKFADIGLHEEHARRLYRQAGFVDEEETRKLSAVYAKPSDWTASAADRLPFPRARAVSSVFDGVRARFHHPLETVQPTVTDVEKWTEDERWRAQFFAHWRLWEKFCTERDYRFAFLPADTRIPDHTIWTHMQVVSALDSCATGPGASATLTPAFLKFQIGPVQDFIAEARSIRDLWSGSYLLSWLMAAGLARLALEIGPDAVVYPNLKGQPLFDLHLREPLWKNVVVNEKTVWEHLRPEFRGAGEKEKYRISPPRYLTPNLPNVFLAVVPADRAMELGSLVRGVIEAEWLRIAQSVWAFCEKENMILDHEHGLDRAARKQRFDAQVKRHFSISFQVTRWPSTLEEALALADGFAEEMPIRKARERVEAIVKYATETMPEADRDGRYYEGGREGPKTTLNNLGLGWSVILALSNWELDATRQTRSFHGWASGGWITGTASNKDSLGGKAEAVAGGPDWHARADKRGGLWRSLFKHPDWLGATTLIKRLWHLAYLRSAPWNLPVDSSSFPMPNTHGIANGDPFSSDDENDESEMGYFAVLAFDGDEIGKWISGEKTPPIGEQLSNYHDGSKVDRDGARIYFEAHGGNDLLSVRRPLSPSYHLQFSQALSNFALQCAQSVVEAFKGRLIYAGGDDVLALLPAKYALACARALREAFQGRPVPEAGIHASHPGFISTGSKDSDNKDISFAVPGSDCECSVGIAIAHVKSPLQDVVRAAQAAEKRAKQNLGRAAVAVTLVKRSGEIIEWGCQWESRGLALIELITDAMEKEQLSGKFPHRVVELLNPYLLSQSDIHQMEAVPGFDPAAVVRREVRHALTRQSRKDHSTIAPPIEKALGDYLKAIGSRPEPIRDVIGLCQTVAFIQRQ